MDRITPDALTPHLEVALMMAPPETLNALQHPDRYRRLRAVSRLADHLAHRLQCFDISLTDGSAMCSDEDGQQQLAGCA